MDDATTSKQGARGAAASRHCCAGHGDDEQERGMRWLAGAQYTGAVVRGRVRRSGGVQEHDAAMECRSTTAPGITWCLGGSRRVMEATFNFRPEIGLGLSGID